MSAFDFVLDNVVAVGNSRSELFLVEVDRSDRYQKIPLQSHAPIGKCTRLPISAISVSESSLAATSGTQLSVWDVLKQQLLKNYFATALLNACVHVTPHLMAVAGQGRQLEMFDERSRSLRPVFSALCALDSIFLLVGDGSSLWMAGADGDVHEIDLRKEVATRHQFDTSFGAVLSLSLSESGFAFLAELNQVCHVPRSSTRFTFRQSLGPDLLSHRIGCDVFEKNGIFHVACGSEHGTVYLFDHMQTKNSEITEVQVGHGMVPQLRWWPHGILACTGDMVVSFLPDLVGVLEVGLKE